jgi:small neutral amino acid transporter SnatA (MarC family)
VTAVAFVLNLAIVGTALDRAALIRRVLGDAGSRAVAKVFTLLLTAIGVTFIRRGLLAAVAGR